MGTYLLPVIIPPTFPVNTLVDNILVCILATETRPGFLSSSKTHTLRCPAILVLFIEDTAIRTMGSLVDVVKDFVGVFRVE